MKYTSIIISLLVLLGVSCKTQQTFKNTPPPYLIKDSNIPSFIRDKYINNKQQIIEKSYVSELEDGRAIFRPEEYFETFALSKPYQYCKSCYESVELFEGRPIGCYEVSSYEKKREVSIIKNYNYKKGHISGDYIIKNLKDSVLYKTRFKGGNGYWKDYYYKINKLREEGQVKNNYKYGAWKYYNKTGKLDSIKHYQLTDSVDVRFPYCLFNKKEPCYKKRSKNKTANKCGVDEIHKYYY
ncbi:MAG: hypothetical protein CR968_00465 [Flavobacteriia bacterium]|nr:MAG: hypothetical protein CR968_00465 [Flavobacteriia bacterium]